MPSNMDKQTHAAHHRQAEVAIAKSFGNPNLDLVSLGFGLLNNVQGARNNKCRVLPKYLVFKGDNGKYLSVLVYEGHNHLNFSSSDIGDSTVLNTIYDNGDGTISIKSKHFGKFWTRSPTNWIWADSFDPKTSDTSFKVIQIQGNCIALQNKSNYCFCEREQCSCLGVAAQTITAGTKLWLVEPVLSREIYDVDFNLSKARICATELLTMSSASAVNKTSSTNKYKLDLSYTETTRKNWDCNVTLKTAVETTIESGVPLIVKGEIKVSAEISASYTWGMSIEESVAHQAYFEADVPPKTKVTVTAIVTRGFFEIPFSYKQADLLTTGEEEIYELNDGIYKGVNCYNLKYETNEEKI